MRHTASVISRLPVPLRRAFYRVAFVALRVLSHVFHPRTRGVKCLVVRRGEVLLVRHSYGPRQWDLVGGFCRRGEDFADAARREALEELGVEIVALTDLGEKLRGLYGRHETLRLFRIEVDAVALAIDHGELAEIRWCARDALPLPRSELIDVALERDRG
jgi:ADP-ribose pyrophosphatase YjhB (NUDIX family)